MSVNPTENGLISANFLIFSSSFQNRNIILDVSMCKYAFHKYFNSKKRKRWKKWNSFITVRILFIIFTYILNGFLCILIWNVNFVSYIQCQQRIQLRDLYSTSFWRKFSFFSSSFSIHVIGRRKFVYFFSSSSTVADIEMIYNYFGELFNS